MKKESVQSGKRRLLHAYRIGIFLFLIFAIRHQHAEFLAKREGASRDLLKLEVVEAFYPGGQSISDWDAGHGGQNVLNAEGERLGYVIQTSPEADEVYGFSGSTNSLIAFDPQGRILGVKVLRSDDTREHLAEVVDDDQFLSQWNGMQKDEVLAMADIDAVSGATLTSDAIADGIAVRLGGGKRKPRFPTELTPEEVVPFLPGAASFESVEKRPFLKRVLDGEGNPIGLVSRTSPHADLMMGYQGPTDLLLVMDPDELILGLAIRDTYDNEPYVKLLNEDEYFFNAFKGFSLSQIGELEVAESGLDVVSGATKTSVTVVEGLVHSAREIAEIREPVPPPPLIDVRVRDVGTVVVVLLGLVIAFTRLKGKRWLRIAFQGVLIFYLGFINADMVSQALLVGWARGGLPWEVAPGLVLLTLAALITPVFTGKQVYCTHLCPFGAAQDWLDKASRWKISVAGVAEKILSALPVLLLLWCLVIALMHLPISLVALEPFDAFVFRIAGWATLTIAVVGLLASLFVKRAYCRYGCPTGAMLKFIRLGGSASGRIGKRDYVSAGFALVAVVLVFLEL